MGAYRIADELRQHGYSSIVIDMISKMSESQLLDFLEKTVSEETMFLGWSSTFFLDHTNPSIVVPFKTGDNIFIQINKKLKDRYPNLKIVYGGAAAFTLLSQARDGTDFYVDYVVRGMGEGTVIDLMTNIKNNEIPKHLEQIGNTYDVSYDMAGNNHNFRNHVHYWHETDCIVDHECLPIEIARGCIFKCAFCSFPLLGKSKQDNSYIRTEETILQEILDNYEKYKTLTYVITDDTFNERTDKIEMMVRVRDKSKLDLNFVGYNRLDLIGAMPEQMYLLKEMNFNGHFFGIDTMNPDTAKIVGKMSRPEQLVETLYKLKDAYGQTPMIIQAAYVAGLPYETPENISYWVEKLMAPDSPVNAISVHALEMNESSFGKSDIHSNYPKYGYTIDENLRWTNDIWNQFEANEFCKKIRSDLYMSNRQQVTGWLAAGLSRFGYNYYDFINMPARHFEENIRPTLPPLIAKDAERYISRLTGIVNK